MTEGAPDAFTAVGIPARVVNLNDRHGAEEGEFKEGEFKPANLPFIGAIARVFLVEDNQEEMDGCDDAIPRCGIQRRAPWNGGVTKDDGYPEGFIRDGQTVTRFS